MFASFTQCSQALADVEAIDYFFAKALLDLLNEAPQADDFYVLVALHQAQRMGNSCLLLSDIAQQRYFADDEQDKPGWQFADESTLTARISEWVKQPAMAALLTFAAPRLYTQRYWQFEAELVAALAQRLSPLPLQASQVAALQAVWPYLYPCENSGQQDWQQVATALCVNRPLCIVSGGPGTGKTYTIARLLMAAQVAWQGSLSIALAAPTGKAAQRLTESMQAALAAFANTPSLQPFIDSLKPQAVTLHRLLGISRRGVACRYNQQHPLDFDIVIVDESSMIDLALMTRLFRSLSAHTRVILVGDPQQLPSVETGNVLGDIISALAAHHSAALSAQMQAQLQQLCPHLPGP